MRLQDSPMTSMDSSLVWITRSMLWLAVFVSNSFRATASCSELVVLSVPYSTTLNTFDNFFFIYASPIKIFLGKVGFEKFSKENGLTSSIRPYSQSIRWPTYLESFRMSSNGSSAASCTFCLIFWTLGLLRFDYFGRDLDLNSDSSWVLIFLQTPRSALTAELQNSDLKSI